MAVPKGIRSWHYGPYHYCGRCDDRTHISEMTWQRGVLLCPICVDYGEYPLIGERQVAIEKAFEVPSRELEPDPKLTDPNINTTGDDLISF